MQPGTEDRRQATLLALEAYQAFLKDPDSDWRAACGNTKHHISFKTIAEEWLKVQKKDADYKASVIRKFLLPFFDVEKHVTSMSMVTQAMIEEYKAWRCSFWLTTAGDAERDQERLQGMKVSNKQAANYEAPSPNTLNREYPTLRQILLYAGKQGHFDKQVIPTVAAETATANPRPAFLGDDFNVLMREAEKWIKEAKGEDKAKAKAIRDERQLLADWIWVVRYTGLRVPHEAEKLTWANVRLDINMLYVPPDTKTGKRDVPLRDEAVKRIRDMQERREKALGNKLTGEEALFALPNGERCQKLGNMFNTVIERCKFVRHAEQLPYSPYGLRATFATFSLAEGKSYDWLEEVMGTSTRMLKTHYKQGTIEQTQRYLRKAGLLPATTAANTSAWEPMGLSDLDKKDQKGGGKVVLTADQFVPKPSK